MRETVALSEDAIGLKDRLLSCYSREETGRLNAVWHRFNLGAEKGIRGK